MNLIDHHEHQLLEAAFRAGLSIRRSAEYAGVARGTAVRYFRQQPPIICPCGEPLPHRYWCEYRVALSPKRQKFLTGFARGVKPETLLKWERLRADVQTALADNEFLASIDHDAVQELRRFYDPSAPFATEYLPGTAGGDSTLSIVPVQSATQEQNSSALFASLGQLHPAVRAFVLAITDGATVDDAAVEAGLSACHLKIILPRLRIFLRPYVDAA